MMTNLIYDRTLEDVAEVRRLLAKLDPETGDGLTAAEQAKWDAGLKGAYNFTDLNRVEAAVKTLAVALTSAGYPVEIAPVLKGSSRVPAGYTEVEWIQSSGTQYIDTGFKPNQETKMSLNMAFLGTAGENVAGTRNSSSDTTNRFGIVTFGSASKIGAMFRGTATQGIPVDTATHSYALSKSGLTVDGVSYGGEDSGTFACTYSIILFGWNNGANGIVTNKSRISSCDIYAGGALARRFVPCKNPEGTVGLYDLVGGEFYTTPTAVTLPAGYTQIEYLQSSGTQHIDTGFKPNNNSKIVTTLQYVSSSSGNKFCLGARTSNNVGRFSLGYSFGSGGGWFFGHGASVTTVNTTSSPTDKTSVVIDKNVCTIAGQSATATPSTFSTTQNLVLFADNEGGKVGQNGAIKLYDCSIYDNGTLVRNFVPARNSSGTLGLYDTVNGIFYTNQGSGTFTAGADIVGFTAGAEVGKAEDREWQEGDVLYRPQWTTYLDNVQKLRDAYYTLAETGELPKPEDKLKYTGANTIEKVLADIDLLLDGMKSIYRRAGTFTAGGSYTRQMIRSI